MTKIFLLRSKLGASFFLPTYNTGLQASELFGRDREGRTGAGLSGRIHSADLFRACYASAETLLRNSGARGVFV